MAISFVSAGAIASGTSGNITPALPASIAAGDILVLVVGAADNVVVSLPAGYTKKIELNSSTNCRLTVAWARATGSDSAPLVTHAAGNSIFGVLGAYRGCKSAGDPFTDAQAQPNAGTTTSITAPTITPLSGDFVIFAAACGEGGTNNGGVQSITAWSGANPTLTERADYPDAGLGVNLIDGGFATGPSTGGATGARTATLATTAQATANSVGALLALTQDAGGVSFPQSVMLPLTGLLLPGQPSVAPPIGPTQGPDPSTFDIITPLPISQFVHPLSLVLAARLFPAPQPYVQPSSAITYIETGSLSAGALLSGADVFEHSEPGSLLAAALLSGADASALGRAGSLTAGGLVSGADVAEHSEAGALLAAALLSGADAAEHAEAGTLSAAVLLSGADAAQLGRAGSLLAAALLSGADVSVHSEAGALLSQALLSGPSSKANSGKAGSLVAAVLLSGGDAAEHSESGALSLGALASGADAHTAPRTGSLAAGTWASAGKSAQRSKTGALFVVALLKEGGVHYGLIVASDQGLRLVGSDTLRVVLAEARTSSAKLAGSDSARSTTSSAPGGAKLTSKDKAAG